MVLALQQSCLDTLQYLWLEGGYYLGDYFNLVTSLWHVFNLFHSGANVVGLEIGQGAVDSRIYCRLKSEHDALDKADFVLIQGSGGRPTTHSSENQTV